MNFNFYLVKSFRILLFPFSLVVWLCITIRNWMYNKGYSKAATFNMPLICVGNISVGGTGKSPMVEYLLRMLGQEFKVATLSRGYKRKTKGYALANEATTALEIGDEPMQFYTKFPNAAIAVGEERLEAVPQLLHDKPGTQVILLDDAFQHRSIKAGLNILLTDYSNLFTRDFFLPTGDLRDQRSSYKRAEIIVVTKCPATLTEEEKKSVTKEIAPLSQQNIFFCTTLYGHPYQIITRQERQVNTDDEILLVCGIANPKPLKNYLLEHSHTYYDQLYSDHHIFTIDDLQEITKKFTEIAAEHKMIITTEKDAVRLMKFEAELNDLPLYVLPVEHFFLFEEGPLFEAGVVNFIENFSRIK